MADNAPGTACFSAGGCEASRFKIILVTLLGLASGAKLWSSNGTDAVRMALTCTVKVFTGLGLIGSVEPGAGAA